MSSVFFVLIVKKIVLNTFLNALTLNAETSFHEETRQIIQNKFKFARRHEAVEVETIEHSEWWHHVEKGLFKPHEANLCDELWRPISKMHKLIWDLRVQKRKEKQKEKEKPK